MRLSSCDLPLGLNPAYSDPAPKVPVVSVERLNCMHYLPDGTEVLYDMFFDYEMPWPNDPEILSVTLSVPRLNGLPVYNVAIPRSELIEEFRDYFNIPHVPYFPNTINYK